MRVGLALAWTLILLPAATAEIRVNEVRYDKGFLIVKGETSRPYQSVTLEKRFRQRSDQHGHFNFRLRYVAPLCKVGLKAGRDEHAATVANCWTNGLDPRRLGR